MTIVDLTLQEIESMMRERDLVMRLDYDNDGRWVVWLYPADDPALGVFTGESENLTTAIRLAFKAWDGSPHADN